MLHARRHIIQLKPSVTQPALAKTLAEIRSQIVRSLCWSGIVRKMAYGQDENDMRAICCRQLFTAIACRMAYGPGETDMRAICCRQLFTAMAFRIILE